MSLKPLLVNEHETVTDRELREVATSHGARVCPKVGLRDVISLSGLSHDLRSYALKAHLDFVVIDESTNLPLFAVEADGSAHDDPLAQHRDQMKNTLVERGGIPLLRVDHTFMRSFRRFTLLAWLVEIWFLHREWEEAQERGDVPFDEPFCHWSFIELDQLGNIVDFPYDLASDAKRFLVSAWEQKRIPRFTPEIRMRPDMFNRRRAYTEAYAVLEVDPDQFLIGYARCRTFNMAGVGPWDLVEDLAEIAVAEKLKSYLAGEGGAVGRDEVFALIEKTTDWRPLGQPFTKDFG